jgi:transcriptional regulator with XRE-family HTH domain
MYETTGTLLWEQRTKKGLTQAELAEASGVPERTIRRVENGAKPQSETVRKLAKALGIPRAARLGREWDETQWDYKEVPVDWHDESGLGGQIGGAY